MWLAMKLGVSLAMTTPLPSRWSANSEIAETTVGSVSAAGITSSRWRYRGGLKKCVPRKCRRNCSLRPAASAAMGMPEVLELTIVSGPRSASSLARSACLASRRSTIASTIQSARAARSRAASKPSVETSAAVPGVKRGSGLSARARSNPSRAVFASRSSSSVGTPALAKCAAIWAPIVPAPRTAAEVILITPHHADTVEAAAETARPQRESGLIRMRRYSIWPRSPSRPIGPVGGTARLVSSTSPLAVACATPPWTVTTSSFQSCGL